MKNFIEGIQSALMHADEAHFEEELVGKSEYIWQRNYPIAIVHDKARIKEEEIGAFFEKEALLDAGGLTHSAYTARQLDAIAINAPAYMQRATMMVLSKKSPEPLHFSEKFPKDFWKKLQDTAHIKAVVEIGTFSREDDVCSVEFALREVMRKRKEVNALKKLPFVWIAVLPKAIMIDAVMKHYFLENHTRIEVGEMVYHIGWNETLKGINMRYFVCPPN